MSENVDANESKSQKIVTSADLDQEFKRSLKDVAGFERLKYCYQCGTCTADCPIARYCKDYRPRKLARMTQLGLKNRLLEGDAIWLCAGCFTCVDHCPQGVDLAGVMRGLRNIAVKEGIIPNVFRELTDNIMKTGYAYKIPELRLKRRAERGLPLLPKADVESVSKLLEIIGVKSRLERKRC
ncbi:MAG: 4Fe-4S dicluster domain-containing protein [Candidatus Bathyarchaeia archaeon]|jgi:heterodisulfide reductase subunit C